ARGEVVVPVAVEVRPGGGGVIPVTEVGAARVGEIAQPVADEHVGVAGVVTGVPLPGVIPVRPPVPGPVIARGANVRRNGEVERAVGVEVAHGDRLRARPVGQGDAGGRPEGAVAVAAHHAHVAGIGGRDVELAVAVEVADRDGERVGSGGGVHRRLEGAVAV